MEPLGLQIFQRPDLYNWTAGDQESGFVNLALSTAGDDKMKLRDARRLTRALSDLSPDVVVINGWGMRDSIVAHLWCRMHRVPRVLVTDSQEADFRRRWHKERIKKTIIEGTGSVFVAGAPHRRYAVNLGIASDKITDGCDVVDNQHFAVARDQRTENGFRILTVARLSPEKNLIAAAEAFLKFLTSRPESEPWVWSIAGYGSLEQQLQEYERRSNGRIKLLGAKNYDELPSIYGQADLYWQPSLRDSWALPVNEAMAAGLPTLVSNRCGCHEDLVKPETGWTFDPMSIESMADALVNAASSHDIWPAMGEASASVIAKWGLSRFSTGLNDAASMAAQGKLR